MMLGMLRFYFGGSGRICRKDFWLKYVLVLVGLNIAAELIDGFVLSSTRETGPAAMILGLVSFWPQIVVTAKRLHDRGMSGWWQVLFTLGLAVPLVVLTSVISDAGGFDGVSLSSPQMAAVAACLLVSGASGLLELVILGFLPGTRGRNKYGDDPLDPSTGTVANVFA